MLKIKKGIAPTLIRQILFLNKKNSFELRNRTDFAIPAVNSVHNGVGTNNSGNVTVRFRATWMTVRI